MGVIKETMGEQGAVSLMRVQSALMFVVSTVYLFTNVTLKELTWEGFLLVTFLFGMSFFPKTIQKKYEKLITK